MTASLETMSQRIATSHAKASRDLLAERNEAGHWVGELSSSALSTATAISALSFVEEAREDWLDAETVDAIHDRIDAGIRWLVTQQNPDGGFGDTDLNYSNISTTMLVVAAFKAAGVDSQQVELIASARKYIEDQGSIDGLRRRYGRDKTFAVPILANCAMAGDVPWAEVATLPFEAATVPQSMYHLMRMPVVSYAIPALVAIGQAKFFHDPPWNPLARLLRSNSIARTLNVLKRMQPASGGFLEAIPLTSFVVMGLATTGRADHPVVQSGVRFLLESFRTENDPDNGPSLNGPSLGSWPIDTNLATWNTTLAINAICRDESADRRAVLTSLLADGRLLDWLLACQNREVHPFTGAKPGGWGWSDLSGAVPDADDTPGALLALKNILTHADVGQTDRQRIRMAARVGINWLLSLQNRDKGWPTFCRGWGKLPFDRSGADITAHVLRALYAWRNDFSKPGDSLPKCINRAIERGVQYLHRQQRDDGSWLPLWFGNQDLPDDENPVYGTSKVLLALHELGFSETSAARKGLKWLRDCQNSDGGWGGGESRRAGNGERFSSVEETALALETIVSMTENLTPDDACVNNGASWLIEAVEQNRHHEVSPIGFYFAKLWYHEKLYPMIFTVSALGALKNSC